jgi:hypothetical protein
VKKKKKKKKKEEKKKKKCKRRKVWKEMGLERKCTALKVPRLFLLGHPVKVGRGLIRRTSRN